MPVMTYEDIFLGFLVALASGALIGIEREQSAAHEHKPRLGGIRTFPLLALAGALSALLAHSLGVWPVLGALLVIGTLLAVSYFEEWTRDATPGVTTEVAALITFLLGVMALLPDLPMGSGARYLLIVSSAAVVMALLSFKAPLHRAVARVSEDDIYATAKFVILALVVLPLLPNRTMGPLSVLNPYDIGIMVVLIAGVSFLGYIATRMVGESKGLAVTGALGGLVSSTAVAVGLSGRAAKTPALIPGAAGAIMTASSTMFLRILVIVFLVDFDLIPALIVPLGVMTLVGYGMSAVFYLRQPVQAPETKGLIHRNPFALTLAFRFGLAYAGIIFGAQAARLYFGEGGLYAASVLAGLTEVDAITLSVARFHQEGLAGYSAATAITLAAMTNSLVKAAITAWLGGRALALRVTGGLLLTVMAGGVFLMATR